MLSQPPTLQDIQNAQSLTDSIVRKTPIITSNYFNELLGMENVPQGIHAEACFTLADIYEHRHEYKRAAELLQKIVDTYPNPNVVRYKLNYLQQK